MFPMKQGLFFRRHKIRVSAKGFAWPQITICAAAEAEKSAKIHYEYEDIAHESYHNQIKPLIWLMRLFGCLPINMKGTGIPTFRLFSFVTAYTLCFWLILSFCCYVVVSEHWDSYINTYGQLGPSIFNSIQIVTMFCIPVVPPASILDVRSFIRHIENWVDFQMYFTEVTGNVLRLSMKRTCFLSLTMCGVAAVGASWFHFYPPYVEWRNMFPYISLVVITCFVKISWYSSYRCLYTANEHLVSCFKQDLRKQDNTYNLLYKYRLLWWKLSQLVSETGYARGHLLVTYHIFVLIFLALTTYGCMTGIRIKEDDRNFRIMFMTVACLIIGLPFYFLCHYADKVSMKVKNDIQEILQRDKMMRRNIQVTQEVKLFLLTILTNPPVITVHGFTPLNRGLFKAYGSALITYLIVLLQFDVGQHEEKHTTNASF